MGSTGLDRREEQACEVQGGGLSDYPDLSARALRADRNLGLQQMFGETGPFIMALFRNLFELFF